MPGATPAALHAAVIEVARYDSGHTKELSGLAAWLDFYRAPWAGVEPLDEADVPEPGDAGFLAALAAALRWVAAHPEPTDSFVELESIPTGLALNYSPDAVPPFDKFQALCDREKDFKRVLDHKRADLEEAHLEGYDAVLAEYAVADGWSDQEVLNLLVFHHNKWLEDPMPDRGIVDAARERADAPQPAAVIPIRSEAKAELSPAIAKIRRALKVPVAGVRKLGRKRGIFELVLDDSVPEKRREIELGTAAALLSMRHVQEAMVDHGWPTFPPIPGAQWLKVVDAVTSAATVEEIDADQTQETLFWLRNAKVNCAGIMLDRDSPHQIANDLRDGANQPIYLGRGEMFVCLPALIRHVHIHLGVRPTWPDMSLRLRRLGFRTERLQVRDGGSTVKARLWVSPRGFTLDE